MDAKLREVLLEIVQDLADLRANQAVLAARIGSGTSTSDAQDAKTAAMKQHNKAYNMLRVKIESLK
jgi:hypothetical protein